MSVGLMPNFREDDFKCIRPKNIRRLGVFLQTRPYVAMMRQSFASTFPEVYQTKRLLSANPRKCNEIMAANPCQQWVVKIRKVKSNFFVPRIHFWDWICAIAGLNPTCSVQLCTCQKILFHDYMG